MDNIIDFLHQMGKLKDIKRAGWVLRNITDSESVADHIFRTTIMALLLSDKLKLDKNKCVQMALIHDIGESLIGDITPHDDVSKTQKHKLEKEAMHTLLKNLSGNNIMELWEEYEEGKTPEAKFIYELDKLEMLIQAFEYEQKHRDRDLSDFWSYVEQRVKEPKMIEILKILKGKKDGVIDNA